MLRTLAIVAPFTTVAASSAMADRYCRPGYSYSYRYNDCIAYHARHGAVVGGARYVARSAVNFVDAAVGTAGAIVTSVPPIRTS